MTNERRIEELAEFADSLDAQAAALETLVTDSQNE
jgi:hypothetical protein